MKYTAQSATRAVRSEWSLLQYNITPASLPKRSPRQKTSRSSSPERNSSQDTLLRTDSSPSVRYELYLDAYTALLCEPKRLQIPISYTWRYILWFSLLTWIYCLTLWAIAPAHPYILMYKNTDCCWTPLSKNIDPSLRMTRNQGIIMSKIK